MTVSTAPPPVPTAVAGRARVRPRCRWAAAAVLVGAVVLAGCGRNDFPDRTAEVTVGSRTATFTVTSCGLDGRTVFLLARAPGGQILQAVVGLAADRETGVPASTGVTVTRDGRDQGAFGAESWSRRGMRGTPPGTVTSARLRGSRIQVSGRVEALTDAGLPDRGPSPGPAVTGAAATGGLTPFSVDARCDQRDDADR